eukprot:3841610-Alexandrium_andersonii.AAC.1
MCIRDRAEDTPSEAGVEVDLQAGEFTGGEKEILHQECLTRAANFAHQVISVSRSVGPSRYSGPFDDGI